MENLKALVYGKELNKYQRKLAQKEFEKLEKHRKEANEFIKDVAEMVGIDTDVVGFDGITLSLDDFEEAIKGLSNGDVTILLKGLEHIHKWGEEEQEQWDDPGDCAIDTINQYRYSMR